MLTLNASQVRFLRARGHALKPVVMIGGKGLSEEVLREIGVSLDAHELVKIKVQSDEREARQAMLEEIRDKLGAVAVQHIGKHLLVYRATAKPKLILP